MRTIRIDLTMLQLETLIIFIRERNELWRATCEQMGTDPDAITKSLIHRHAKLVQEAA